MLGYLCNPLGQAGQLGQQPLVQHGAAARAVGLAMAATGTRNAMARLRARMIFMTAIGANPAGRDSKTAAARAAMPHFTRRYAAAS
jgi:hypothetical protein